MGYISASDRLSSELRAALPGLSVRTANSLARTFGYRCEWDAGAVFDVVRVMSDDDLLALRSFGFAALDELRSALAATDYDPGACNWVGEGVPA